MSVDARICPSCGGTFDVLYKPFAVPINQTVSIDQCAACGLAERQPGVAFDFTDLDRIHYMDDWKALDLSGLGFKYDRIMEAARDLSPWIVKDGPWGRSILDVGCGAGYFLSHCRAHGWAIKGADKWGDLADWGRKYLKVDIAPQPIETAGIDDSSFEAVTAFDVISFVDDPVAFLKACRDKLKPGGLFALTTPNFDSAARKEYGADWPQLGANVRRWFFTPESLETAARAAGFGAVRTQLAGGPNQDEELFFFAQNPFKASISWTDIAEDAPSDNMLPPLDRASVNEDALSPAQKHWREEGYLILRDFIPHDIIDAYCKVRERLKAPGGWDDETPYMEVKEIRDVCLYGPLAETLEALIGEPMVMNLNLTGWSKILNFVPEEVRQTRAWPIHSERVLTPFFEEMIDVNDLEKVEFTAEKGDVLIWHARLLHRGTVAKKPDAVRKAIISHYTALGAMSAYGPVERWKTGGLYFADPTKRDVDPELEVKPGE